MSQVLQELQFAAPRGDTSPKDRAVRGRGSGPEGAGSLSLTGRARGPPQGRGREATERRGWGAPGTARGGVAARSAPDPCRALPAARLSPCGGGGPGAEQHGAAALSPRRRRKGGPRRDPARGRSGRGGSGMTWRPRPPRAGLGSSRPLPAASARP